MERSVLLASATVCCAYCASWQCCHSHCSSEDIVLCESQRYISIKGSAYFLYNDLQLQISRVPYTTGSEWRDTSLVLPMVYDVSSNITQLAERREQPQSPAMNAVSVLLRRFAEYANLNECTIFPAVRELLTNLQWSNDLQPQQQLQNQVS